jgi:hypothetical protein
LQQARFKTLFFQAQLWNDLQSHNCAGTAGYYHVLTDLLPRMIIAKELLLDVDDTTLFIIQSDHGGVMKPYLIQLLALLRYLDMQL